MNYLMQRSQIYIRPNPNIPFHSEVDPNWFNRIKDTIKEFSHGCEITSAYHGDNILRYTFFLPNLDDYLRMTDCLYVKGNLKEVFKDAMRHTKTHGIAFAMPSWWLNKINDNGVYFKEWYTNKKTRTDSKFLEEIRETLPDRMYALKGYMKLDECVMNCAIYDYTHTIKHSYFLYTKRDEDTERKIDDIRQNASMNFQYKRDHNEKNGIEYFIGRNFTRNFEYHDFDYIPEGVFDKSFTDLKIPIKF